jgi:ribosomal protein S18 acetylase RimI-like enzyme
MPQEWKLRPGREDDIRPMYMLDLVCFDEPFRFNLRSMRQFVLQDNAIVLVAESGNRLVGFVVVHLVEKNAAYVVTLDVVGELRRRGLGGALIAAAEVAAKQAGAQRMVLHVSTDNHAAIGFYERHQFAWARPCAEFYGPGLDAALYEKCL